MVTAVDFPAFFGSLSFLPKESLKNTRKGWDFPSRAAERSVSPAGATGFGAAAAEAGPARAAERGERGKRPSSLDPSTRPAEVLRNSDFRRKIWQHFTSCQHFGKFSLLNFVHVCSSSVVLALIFAILQLFPRHTGAAFPEPSSRLRGRSLDQQIARPANRLTRRPCWRERGAAANRGQRPRASDRGGPRDAAA